MTFPMIVHPWSDCECHWNPAFHTIAVSQDNCCFLRWSQMKFIWECDEPFIVHGRLATAGCIWRLRWVGSTTASMKMNRCQKSLEIFWQDGNTLGRQQALDCCVQTSVACIYWWDCAVLRWVCSRDLPSIHFEVQMIRQASHATYKAHAQRTHPQHKVHDLLSV